jgi:hypothetical protein
MKKISTTKILIAFLFINRTLLEIFTGWVTVENLILARDFGISIDFTPLVTLIGIVLGEVFGFAVYAAKSTKENTAGGIQYEAAMREWGSQNIQEEEFDEEAQG